MNSKKIAAQIIAFNMIFLHVPMAHAGQAIILTDAELDAVHAGGLNYVNFDRFLGSQNEANDHLKSNRYDITFRPQSNFSFNSSKSKITVQESTQPLVPTAPEAPKAPELPKTPDIPSFSEFTPDFAKSELPATTPTIKELTAADQFDVSAGGLSNIAPIAPTAPDSTNIPSQNAVPDLALTSAQTDVVAPSLPVSPTESGVKTMADTGAASSNIAAQNVSAPTSGPTILMDVVSANGKTLGSNIGIQPNESSAVIPLASTIGNQVNVSETAQQNLSALSNINNAGGAVGVNINMLILQNSTIENLHLENNLTLSNYTTYQLLSQ